MTEYYALIGLLCSSEAPGWLWAIPAGTALLGFGVGRWLR